MDDASRADASLELLTAHAYLLHHLNDFFVRNSWDSVPEAWRRFLLSLSATDLAELPRARPAGAPASLERFLMDAEALALPRSPPRPGLQWATAGAATVALSICAADSMLPGGHSNLWKGMDAKKARQLYDAQWPRPRP